MIMKSKVILGIMSALVLMTIASVGIYSLVFLTISTSAASPLSASSNDTYTAQKTAMSNAGKITNPSITSSSNSASTKN